MRTLASQVVITPATTAARVAATAAPGAVVSRRKHVTAALACLALLVLSGSYAAAEKVKGTETCTSGSYARTIGGKKYTCATKCTTPVTDTVCNPNCSTTVYNEVAYKDCTETAQIKRPLGTFGVVPPASILEQGGGGLGPQGPARPGTRAPAAAPAGRIN
jgi:hypothetical protein